VAHQPATALTGRRRKHRPLNDAARGDDAVRAWENLPGGQDPADRALAGGLPSDLEQAARALTPLERRVLAHALVGCSSGGAAHTLGVARKSADNALQRARRKVAEWYEQAA
jgi:DNA-directed RNA polymerase specialized sigma24 family protein